MSFTNTLWVGLKRAKDSFVLSLLTNLIPKVTDINLPFNPFHLSPNICIGVKSTIRDSGWSSEKKVMQLTWGG